MRLKLQVLLIASVALTACHRNRTVSAATMACDPREAQNAADMDLGLLNGGFEVKFVATAGQRAGQVATGRLWLRPQDAGLVRLTSADPNVVVSQPTIGRLDLALDSIGAVRMGDPMSDSINTPGVGLYVTQLAGGGVTGVVARVGSGSNVRGQMLFDGGYFTLHVRRVGPDGIFGSWTSSPGSGGMVTTDPAGHFCAVRTTDGR